MKIKTSDLIGVALDWAVAKCEGWVDDNDPREHIAPEEKLGVFNWWLAKHKEHLFLVELNYSTNWLRGGPILEREKIVLINPTFEDYFATECPWLAWKEGTYGYGDTPLTAAMRCYVASKLGDEIEVPDELSEPA